MSNAQTIQSLVIKRYCESQGRFTSIVLTHTCVYFGIFFTTVKDNLIICLHCQYVAFSVVHVICWKLCACTSRLISCYWKYTWNRKSICTGIGKPQYGYPRYICRWRRLSAHLQFLRSVFAIVFILSTLIFVVYCMCLVVTGCTAGIGDAFCCKFAANQMNILLVGRNPIQLTQLSAKLGIATVIIIIIIRLVKRPIGCNVDTPLG